MILSKDSIPILSSHISKRDQTIEELLQNNDKKWLAINGLYDTGKTQLAILISQFLKSEILWVNCKEVGAQIFIQKILSTFDATSESELWLKISHLKTDQRKLIVLDDLIEFGQNEKIDNFFNNFIKECINSNFFIISTSNYIIHSNIKSIHNENICEQEIKLLDETETLEIVDSYSKSKDFKFRNLIYTIAKGYPVYTQIICRYLDSTNWIIEENQLLDFITGNIFTDLTNETVKKVVNKIQDEDTRSLLYRLNVIITNISDKEIKIVADCSPNINKPEEKINSLIGTWIQQISFANYSISPLIKRLGTNNIHESTLLEINFKLGKDILDKGSLSQIDVFNVITYFSSAKKLEDAGFILMSFLQHTVSQPEYFYRWNFDILWYKTSLPNEMSLQLKLVIRTLHLLIESNRQLEDIPQKNYLRSDLELLVNEALSNKIDVYLPAIVLSYSYLKENGKKAIRYFTYYKNSYTYNNLPDELSTIFTDDIGRNNDSLVWLLLMDISDLDSLNDWFENFPHLSTSVEDFDKEQVDLLSSRLYLNFIIKEESKEHQDWEELLRTFAYIFEKGHQLNLEIFKAYSIKKQIQIISEKLNDIDRAENLFKKYSSFFTDNAAKYLIKDEIGRQVFYKGNKDKSLEYLSQIADIKLEKYNVIQIDTYSVLAKVFGEKDKSIAQYYIDEAVYFAKDNVYVNELWYIKLIGERAVSLYLNNKIVDSLKELSKGYEMLLNSFENDDVYKNVQLIYGNTISYIYSHFEHNKIPEKSETHTPPYRGIFENNNNIAELYTDEKLVIIIAMLVWFFEEIKDRETAYYWATRAFSLQKHIDIKTFRMLFMGLIGYKILDDKYNDAIAEQIEIYNCNEEYLAQNKTNVPNYIKNYSVDFAIIVSAINPIYVRLLYRYLLNEIEIEQANLTVKDLLLEFENHIEDKEVISQISYILEKYPNNETESQNLLKYIIELDSGRLGQVQFLGYIICSMTMKSKLALEAHLVFKDMFQIFSGSINLYIMVPFFIEFWKKKMQKEPSEFRNIKKLEENLDKVKTLKNKLQIKAIFALVSESLNYKLNPSDKIWLEEYYDEY